MKYLELKITADDDSKNTTLELNTEGFTRAEIVGLLDYEKHKQLMKIYEIENKHKLEDKK